MIFQPLASSSHGNAYLVSDSDTRILLECGVSHKKLRQLAGFQLSGLDGVLISHEHRDHSRCVADLIRDGIPVYMSDGTASALVDSGTLGAVALDSAIAIAAGKQFAIGSMDIVPFAVFHDAREPLGFLIRSRRDHDTLVFATDTVNLAYRFPGVNILAIEANYDAGILTKCTRLPEKVRHRITNCHMEIDALCRYLSGLDLSACREIYLLHLSDAMSCEPQFLHRVQAAVPPGIRVEACRKEAPYGR